MGWECTALVTQTLSGAVVFPFSTPSPSSPGKVIRSATAGPSCRHSILSPEYVRAMQHLSAHKHGRDGARTPYPRASACYLELASRRLLDS